MDRKRGAILFSRRLLLRGAGTALVSTPLVGCSSRGGGVDADASLAADADANGAADLASGGEPDATSTPDVEIADAADAPGDGEAGADAAEVADPGPPWATGGTAGMKDKANYPNPFAGPVDATCAILCASDRGPCYSAQVQEIQDISYGYLGLPTRLYFQVLDEACKPIPGASVDIWHVSPSGKYSGNDPVNEDVTFCTGNDADQVAHLYFRGKQTTDATGVVFFDSCFPGWYPHRAVHIHFTVSVGGTSYVTGQVFFADALNDDILESQDLYKDRGRRDTSNLIDSIAFIGTLARYKMQTKKMTDGALLAWKALIVRPPTEVELCFLPFSQE